MFKNTIFLLGIYFISLMPAFSQGFKTKWITNRSGETNDYTVSIKTNSDFAYDYDVDIDEDGIMDFTNVTGDLEIVFDSQGEKIIEIYGLFPHWEYISQFNLSEQNKLVEVMEWGNISWQRFDRMFGGCDSLVISATDAPDLSAVDSLSYAFASIKSFEGNINHWDISGITKLNNTFCLNSYFNSPLDQWDVGNVTDMSYLFDESRIFNHDLSMWDVSKVQNMEGMFAGTLNFNSDISSWDVSNVEVFASMFSRTESFNQDLTHWDVSNGVDFSEMFQESAVFDGDISNWDLKNAETLSYMFASAKAFNQDLNTWDVSNVRDMSYLFSNNQIFNGDIGHWDISKVEEFTAMFNYNNVFNQDISEWNTTSAKNMQRMFKGASSFDQDISIWNYNSLQSLFMWSFAANSGLSIENYDRLLIKMQDVGISIVYFFGDGLEYCKSEEARDYLINTLGWSDIGDEKNCLVSTENLSLSHKIYSASDGIHLTLESPHSEDIFLELFDAQGRPVRTYVHPSGESHNIFDSSNLVSGLYFIRGLGSSIKLYIH